MKVERSPFGSAAFSDEDPPLYRYSLMRNVGSGHRLFLCIGLNPSTADHKTDDPTIRRCKAFAQREDCWSLLMVNLCAFRSKDPQRLKQVPDPVGPDNLAQIAGEIDAWRYDTFGIEGVDDILAVAAWGNPGARFPVQVRQTIDLFSLAQIPLYCFGKTGQGQPKHPLYLRSDTPLELL